ncbi:MAG: sugar phosphate nucleotidyltransferase [Patescibacteria group bacterium]
MKGIILAGGTATRLLPLTATTSKQLLPVYDRQMIFYPLNTLIKAGIKEILVIVAPEHSGQFLNLLGSIFKNYGIDLFFEVQKTPRGLADAFIVGENFIDNDNVTMILGDNIFEDDFSEDIKNFKSGGKIFAKKVNDPERSGVVKFDENNKAIKIVEKPKEWISDYAIPGLYIYDNQVLKVAKEVKPSDRGEIEITSLHNYYLEKGELEVGIVKGEWLDAGTFDSLLEAGNIVKKKEIYKKFDPLIEKAIAEFNEELKNIAKKKLL